MIASVFCSFSLYLSHRRSRGHHIGFEDCRRSSSDDAPSTAENYVDGPGPVLLLNGFGVGSFHQHRLMPRLASASASSSSPGDREIYGIDYLGQGRSWPVDMDDGESEGEKGLRYDINTWADQCIKFIERVVLPEQGGRVSKVHLVGNSVGGYLSVVLASKRPDLIDSICLLNATPVWGLNLPFWSGRLPAPFLPKLIGRFLFDRIRDYGTIEKFLDQTYSRREAFDDELMGQIRDCTEGLGGHAAFASILWSPPADFSSGGSAGDGAGDATEATDFYVSLERLECDVLLLFGRDDPWCKPAFAKRMCEMLDRRRVSTGRVHRYVELEDTGHCPNHEAPQATAAAVNRWLAACTPGERSVVELVHGGRERFAEPWGEIVMREVSKNEISLNFLDRLVTKLI